MTLTVTDNGGKSNTKTLAVTVSGGTPTNTPPTASFTGGPCTVNVDCQFTDTSTDLDGDALTWSWNFGDGTAVVTTQSPTHRFAVAGNYTVSLTVTDDQGAASTPFTQQVTVAAASTQACTTVGSSVICELGITTASHVTATLTGSECELAGNNLTVTAAVWPGRLLQHRARSFLEQRRPCSMPTERR